MADKEINVKFVTDVDLSNLEDLTQIVDYLKDNSNIPINVDSSEIETLTEKIAEAEAEVERLEEALSEAELNGDDIQADIIADELAEATAEVENLKSALDGLEVDIDNSSIDETIEKADELNDNLDELDGKTVSPDVDSSGVEELKDKTEESSNSLDSLATAAAGVGVTAGVEQMVATADRINTSWNQLELTFGSVTNEMKSGINDAANVTGRSGGEIRGYFNQMGIAGVTNTNLLSSSFEALSGKAYQTGNSIESMETKMQTMVLTGNASNRMLKTLGLSAEDLAQAMGVSADQVSEAFKNMTPEERLQAITKAMGDGAEANEMYKNSYEGLKTQAETAMAGLMGAVGQAILPVVIPALQAATNFVKFLTDGFKSLPGPVQAVVGGVLGFAGIALTAIGVLGTMGQMFTMVKGGLEALNLVTKLSAVYNKAAAAAQWLLNIAMDANPIMLVVIAIVALIAILGYLYFTNEDVRNAINGLGESFMQVGQIIYDTIVWAVDTAITALQGLWDYITTLGGFLPNSVSITGNLIIDTVLRVMAFIATLPIQLPIIFANIIAQALGFGSNFSQRMITGAVNAVNGFMSQIRRLPGQFVAELQAMISDALNFAGQIGQILWQAGINAITSFLNALDRHSPGIMQREFIAELTETGERVPSAGRVLVSNVARLGSDVVGSFNPDLSDVSGGVASIGGSGSSVGGGDFIVNVYGDVDSDKRVRQIVDAVKEELYWNNITAGRTV